MACCLIISSSNFGSLPLASPMELSHITYREGQPKTLKVIGKGDRERNIALNEEAARALTYWIRETRRQIAAELPPGKDSDYVWLIPAGRSKGNTPQPQTIRVMLRKFGKMMNLRVHPHKLRGSFITDALSNGAPIHAVQNVVGHADGSTTLGYANAGTAEQEMVVSVLPKIMGKGMFEQPVNNPKEDSDALWALLSPEQKEKMLKRMKLSL
jgi:integrase